MEPARLLNPEHSLRLYMQKSGMGTGKRELQKGMTWIKIGRKETGRHNL